MNSHFESPDRQEPTNSEFADLDVTHRFDREVISTNSSELIQGRYYKELSIPAITLLAYGYDPRRMPFVCCNSYITDCTQQLIVDPVSEAYLDKLFLSLVEHPDRELYIVTPLLPGWVEHLQRAGSKVTFDNILEVSPFQNLETNETNELGYPYTDAFSAAWDQKVRFENSPIFIDTFPTKTRQRFAERMGCITLKELDYSSTAKHNDKVQLRQAPFKYSIRKLPGFVITDPNSFPQGMLDIWRDVDPNQDPPSVINYDVIVKLNISSGGDFQVRTTATKNAIEKAAQRLRIPFYQAFRKNAFGKSAEELWPVNDMYPTGDVKLIVEVLASDHELGKSPIRILKNCSSMLVVYKTEDGHGFDVPYYFEQDVDEHTGEFYGSRTWYPDEPWYPKGSNTPVNVDLNELNLLHKEIADFCALELGRFGVFGVDFFVCRDKKPYLDTSNGMDESSSPIYLVGLEVNGREPISAPAMLVADKLYADKDPSRRGRRVHMRNVNVSCTSLDGIDDFYEFQSLFTDVDGYNPLTGYGMDPETGTYKYDLERGVLHPLGFKGIAAKDEQGQLEWLYRSNQLKVVMVGYSPEALENVERALLRARIQILTSESSEGIHTL